MRKAIPHLAGENREPNAMTKPTLLALVFLCGCCAGAQTKPNTQPPITTKGSIVMSGPVVDSGPVIHWPKTCAEMQASEEDDGKCEFNLTLGGSLMPNLKCKMKTDEIGVYVITCTWDAPKKDKP
jgi:hypothetical protein